MLYDFIYIMTFLKRQNYGGNKKTRGCQGLGWVLGGGSGAEKVFRTVKILCMKPPC